MQALEELSPDRIPERLAAIARGGLGVLVRALVTAEAIAADRARIARASLPRVEMAPGAHTLGCMLAPSIPAPNGPRFERYLEAAAGFPADLPLVAAAHAALSALSGLPVRIPTAPDGRPYAPATLRIFKAGGESPLHCDTYRELPCLAHLDQIADRRPHLSWYLTLVAPPRGGELVIVDRRHGDRPGEGSAGERRHVTRPSDFVAFDAGRWFHRVSRCEGGERHTLGGFAAPARDGSVLYAWG